MRLHRTRPVAVGAISIGEEIIRLHRPTDVAVAGLGGNIIGRCGVQYIDTAIGVHVVDQPVFALSVSSSSSSSRNVSKLHWNDIAVASLSDNFVGRCGVQQTHMTGSAYVMHQPETQAGIPNAVQWSG